MACILESWFYFLGATLLGALGTWFFMKNKIGDLLNQLSRKSDKIINLENDYAGLRASSQEQILALKEEKQGLIAVPIENDLIKKYDKLKVEYNNLQSKIHQLERLDRPKKIEVVKKKTEKESSKSNKKYESLHKEYQSLKKKIKNLDQLKSNYKKSLKAISNLKKENESLKDKLKKKKDPKSVEKKVEIIKSLRTKKLKDWLSRDKAYKVRKKVSTSKLKGKS